MFERFDINNAISLLFNTINKFKGLEKSKKVEMDGGKYFVRKIKIIYRLFYT